MYIAILGRQPALGVGELESLYGPDAVRWFSDQSATIAAPSFSIDRLGGTQKAGRVVAEISQGDWRRTSVKIIQDYAKVWASFDGKLTLGISAYGFDVSARDVQKTGIVLKQKLKGTNASLRLIPNAETALSSATSHHNKLGLSENKIELIAARARNGRVIIAESVGTQNITSYAKRDQNRPKRDAFVGMLPPKLAQIMINLATPTAVQKNGTSPMRILDPFCGTGVILQEAALMGYSVYGTDLADKMIEFSATNLKWLEDTHDIEVNLSLHQGDAMDTQWQPPIDAVVCESYLGQPFSAPPSPSKLEQVRKNCDYIITAFLKNIANQTEPGVPFCIAVPAWRDNSGGFTHLSLTRQVEQLGYRYHEFKNIRSQDLLYYRENQVVARELIVLVRS
jgi:tRNA G10  N-methylase Trm11